MTDKTASDAEPTDLKSALIELRHAREEITRLRPFVDIVDQAQRDDDAAVLPAPAGRADVYREVADRLAADAEQGEKEGFTRIYRRSAAKQVREWADELRRVAGEAPGPDRCSGCRYVPCDDCRRAAAGSAVAGHTGDETAHREPVNPCTRGSNFCGQHGYDCPPDEPAAGLPAGGAPHTKEA